MVKVIDIGNGCFSGARRDDGLISLDGESTPKLFKVRVVDKKVRFRKELIANQSNCAILGGSRVAYTNTKIKACYYKMTGAFSHFYDLINIELTCNDHIIMRLIMGTYH